MPRHPRLGRQPRRRLSVDNSNSLYEYAGIDQTQPELLYAKTFTCAADCCRGRDAISTEFRGCKFAEYTGRWRQETVQAKGAGEQRLIATRRLQAREFAEQMSAEHLYAVFGGYAEKGGRPYWLLWSKSKAYKAPKAPDNKKADDGSTIRGGTWIFDAYWFKSTSDSFGHRTYVELPALVHVTQSTASCRRPTSSLSSRATPPRASATLNTFKSCATTLAMCAPRDLPRVQLSHCLCALFVCLNAVLSVVCSKN